MNENDVYRLRTHGSRYGVGKVHLREGYNRTICRPAVQVHSEPVGNDVPLTCKLCLKIAGKA